MAPSVTMLSPLLAFTFCVKRAMFVMGVSPSDEYSRSIEYCRFDVFGLFLLTMPLQYSRQLSSITISFVERLTPRFLNDSPIKRVMYPVCATSFENSM